MWMMKVLARKKDLLVRKLEAKAKEARVVSGLRSHCQLDIGRIVRGVNPFLRKAKKPRMPYARSWKPTIATQDLPTKYQESKFGTYASHPQLPQLFTWSELDRSDLQT